MRTNSFFNACFILGGALLFFTGCGSDCEALVQETCDCAELDDCSTGGSYTAEEEEVCAEALELFECES